MKIIRFTPDDYAMADIKKHLASQPVKMRTAGRDALNRTMEQARTVTATALSGAMSAKKSSVMKRLSLLKATMNNISAAMIIRGGRGVNLASFGARQTKKGVTATIYGEKKSFPDMFIVPGLNGNKIVVWRVGAKRAMVKGKYAGRIIKRGPRAGQPLLRQALSAQYGPSVAEAWEKTPGMEKITSDAVNGFLDKNIRQQIKRFS